MTCIVGYKDGTDIIIAGDSLISFGDLAKSGVDKVFLKDNIIFGMSGRIRNMQVLQYGIGQLPEHPSGMSDMEYLCTIFSTTIYDEMKSYGVTSRNNIGIAGLIGYNGELYQFNEDLAIIKIIDNYAAWGSGVEVATGALAAFEYTNIPKIERLIKAIEITAKYINSVNADTNYKILSMKKSTTNLLQLKNQQNLVLF